MGNALGTDGTLEIFPPAETEAEKAAKIVSAPITTTTSGTASGELRIRDFDFTFQSAIGATGGKLSTVRIDNAKATFGAGIFATSVTLNPKAQLALSNDLTISNTLTLNNRVTTGSTATTGGATLALGSHTLTASGAVSFNNTVTATDTSRHRDQPVELSFTAYNRENSPNEGGAAPELVVSPAPPGTTVRTFLPRVANVITFGSRGVLGRSDANVASNPDASYGRIVEHSYRVSP